MEADGMPESVETLEPVSQVVQPVIVSVANDLQSFYLNYIEPSLPVQVFQSFTYGEMTIAALLLAGIVLFCLKWIWEVLR
jgi:hypothetical protein